MHVLFACLGELTKVVLSIIILNNLSSEESVVAFSVGMILYALIDFHAHERMMHEARMYISFAEGVESVSQIKLGTATVEEVMLRLKKMQDASVANTFGNIALTILGVIMLVAKI